MKTEKKDYSGEYNSTYGFVWQNNLEDVAEKLFGKGWEAEDDVNQIERLIGECGGEFYVVSVAPHKKEDDIIVEQSKELERIDTLEQALKGLIDNVNLSKLNIKKDFSLINAHAYANKVLTNK